MRLHSLHRQRGAVILMTTGFMLLGVLFLALAIDSGRLFMEKRSLQRIADIAALEAATRFGCKEQTIGGVTKKWRAEFAQEAALRNGFNGTVTAACGDISDADVRVFTVNEVSGKAIRVEVQDSTVASIVAGGVFTGPINLRAEAVAIRAGNALAGLTIRSTTATINTQDSILLNTILGGLLGTSLNISAVGYNGLVGTQVKLLDFLDALAIELGLGVGDYEQVLSTQLTVGQLIGLTADAISREGAQLATGAGNLNDVLVALGLVALSNNPAKISLGELLNVQTTDKLQAANVDLNLLDLVQGSIQLASSNAAVGVDLPVNVPGVAALDLSLRVVEPSQMSAVGDPAEVDPVLGANDPNAIYVRTAQIRAYISLNLSAVNSLLTFLNGVLGTLLGPLFDLLSLNVAAVANLFQNLFESCGDIVDPLNLFPDVCPDRSVSDARLGAINVGLEVGGANAYVTDYSCAAEKQLITESNTEVAYLYIGSIDKTNFFNTAQVVNVDVSPTSLLSIGTIKVRYNACVGLICSGPVSYKTATGYSATRANALLYPLIDLQLKASPDQVPEYFASRYEEMVFDNPPDFDSPPAYQPFSTGNIVQGLAAVLGSARLELKSTNFVISGLGTIINFLLNQILIPLVNLLGQVLDPLLNGLLTALGVNLVNADLGAQLDCEPEGGARLVN